MKRLHAAAIVIQFAAMTLFLWLGWWVFAGWCAWWGAYSTWQIRRVK